MKVSSLVERKSFIPEALSYLPILIFAVRTLFSFLPLPSLTLPLSLLASPFPLLVLLMKDITYWEDGNQTFLDPEKTLYNQDKMVLLARLTKPVSPLSVRFLRFPLCSLHFVGVHCRLCRANILILLLE